MRKQILILILTLMAMYTQAGDKPAYVLYDQEGKETKYAKMMKALEEADIIFFGELHTDPIAHWLQIEMTGDLYEVLEDQLVLGAEMFEADNQLIMDEYLSGAYKTDKFEAEMRLWGNYQTDYKPLVEFAKEKELRFIATNIPRRYASVVHYKGFEGLEKLPAEALSYMAPLPILYDPEVKCYKDMLEMMPMGKKDGDAKAKQDKPAMPAMHAMPAMPADTAKKAAEVDKHAMPAGMPGMKKAGPPMANLPKAQAAKDATMAHFIMENWTKGQTMFHFNGEYHSRNFEGIVWHLKQSHPELKIMTISTVQQKDVSELEEENTGIANYVVCVPESMTRTKR